jgi:hypothetical protein
MPAPVNRTPFQQLSSNLASFARKWADITLRPYQVEAAQAVLDSIHQRAGRSIVIMFSRQSGKDELSANLKTYLLSRLHRREGGIVEVNPTYKPQTINAMERLERRLQGNPLARKHWRKRSDFIRFLGRLSVTFLSGDAKANVVGAVASLLLIVNEAQDIDPAVYDRNFAPMAASTNATRLFMGTAWTSRTLLSRELRAALQAQRADGIRRVFTYDADDVRRAVPAYGIYVDEQIARLGRGHPLIKTQYFNEEIDAQAGMFTPARRALMGCESAPDIPLPALSEAEGSGAGALPAKSKGRPIVFTLDVAGQDEAAFHNPDEQMLRNPGRDAVSLTIASVDLSAMQTLQAPIFRILHREQWTGLNHLAVFGRLTALADRWRPQHIVIDATGVGEGLWAMLDKRHPTRVIPVKFSAQKKSELGYRFLAMIETGRLRDCAQGAGIEAPDASASGNAGARTIVPLPGAAVTRADVDRQYAACVSEVLLGPQKLMRWGVPDGTRDENGDLIHDDIVMADALLAEADLLEWRVPSKTLIIRPKDPLDEMSHFRERDS